MTQPLALDPHDPSSRGDLLPSRAGIPPRVASIIWNRNFPSLLSDPSTTTHSFDWGNPSEKIPGQVPGTEVQYGFSHEKTVTVGVSLSISTNMADETKAANHIDFTSIPYEGPGLQEGKEILTATRAAVAEQTPSAQHGWAFSGILQHRVIVEQGPGTRPACRVQRAPRPPFPGCSARARYLRRRGGPS
jgi:hypothetical protein